VLTFLRIATIFSINISTAKTARSITQPFAVIRLNFGAKLQKDGTF
jgi:hypothetical protein